ncbi:MAG: hypothetical protein HC938_17650 [Nitrospira sp.]|nr:hypothetical protein [Nitrospira sp.]
MTEGATKVSFDLLPLEGERSEGLTLNQLELRAMARQSLDKIEARMTEWSQLAQQPDSSMRVAGLIGVTPVKDAGMPVRLALAPAETPVELAAMKAIKAALDSKGIMNLGKLL